MQHYLYLSHLERISTGSTGFIEAEERPSPEHAVKAAKAFGVDLAERSSKSVNRQLLEGSDIIFCMDVDNYLSPLRKNGLRFKKTFSLGHLSHNPVNTFIEDPYEGEEEDFVSCYHHIDMCIKTLLNEIKKYFAIME
jgi:protein-tyrosine-phosphatase